ncbi:kelch-like protein 33 [Hippoglossus hippoglossus]|uniref:kelch-like protein 33 n=1 Tax=Hippoglossus hippoglossus TaxID=8267 RepID=UPI00148C36D0|nr:kelch-like protein 33 [Hippoglossus hippoglossus]
MEFSRHNLPMDWEERWRKEKERRKRVIEEGGEGMKQENRELRRIVAYNDSRMGLSTGGGETEGSEVGVIRPRPEGIGERRSEEAFRDEGRGDNVHIYHSERSSKEMFRALKELWDSSLLTDLTLNTENGSSLHVHSPVLAAVSSVLLQRLRDTRGEHTDEDGGFHRWSVSLGSEVDPVGLQAVVEFAYTGVISPLNKDTTANVKAAAQALGVARVLEICNEEEGTREDGRAKKEERKISAVDEMKISLRSVEQLWADGVGCDVILDVDGTLHHVHRVILAASSDYFRGMFTCGMRESHLTCVALPFLVASDFQALIGCSYSGTLSLSWDCVFEITCTALQLQFQPALSLCLDFMRCEMEAESCLDIASFAEAYGMSELLEEANDFVLRNFWEVSSTAKFQDLPAEKLLDYLSCDGLCVPSELAVFRAVISWIEADPEERLGQAGRLMTAVRFPLMTFREFREVRAINLRLECFGNKEVELYGSALKEFGFSLPQPQDQWRVRRPKDALVLVGGDQLNPDMGQRIPSRELWFANSLRSGTGLVREMEWRRMGEMPDKPKFRHGVTAMDGKLYVIGGCYFYAKDNIMKSAHSYDPVQNSWKRLADMLEFRSNFSVVALERRLYAVGGDKEIDSNVHSVEMYNPDTDSWSFVQPLDRTLSGSAVTVVDGGIFVSGGFDCRYVCLASMFLYHPQRGTTYLADMAHDRAQHCMEALRGRLYVTGGVCNLRAFYTNQQACEVFDPVTDSWTALASLPVPHVGAASAVLEEKIYILGGYCQDDYSESGLVHRFDPCTQRWENMGKLPGAVTDIRACLLRLPQHFRH